MFADLLRIKKFREDAAEQAVKQAESVLAEKRQAVEDAKKAVTDHETFRIAEEARMFDEIKGREVKRERLDLMNEMIAILRSEELKLREEVIAVEKKVPPAEKKVQEAEAKHHEAVLATRKFEEFVAEQRAAEAKAAVAAEEAEIEEVSEAGFAARNR
ncbi:MAG: YscO family type III secretion system apparatus protein [Pseudomonadota bacterium]